MSLLASLDEAARLRVIKELADEQSGEQTGILIEALNDESWQVRRAAVDALARSCRPETLAALIAAFREQQHSLSVINGVLQVLSLAEIDVITPLVELLSAHDADLRVSAALALGDQNDPRAIPALIGALRDPDTNVRYHAIEALGKLRATEATDDLLGVAESRNFFLAFPALEALARIGDQRGASRIVPLLENDMLRVPAVETLGQLGDEQVVKPLVELLQTGRAPASSIARALATLHERYERSYGEGEFIADLVRRFIDDSGIRRLLDGLDETHGQDVRALTLIVGWLHGPTVERALVRLLGDTTVRREVLAALVRQGARVTRQLVAQLDAVDAETRQAAAVALGRIGDASAVPALIRLLEEDDDLAITAARALAAIGDRRAFDALLHQLEHPTSAVRQAAIAALNSLGHPALPKHVKRLLSDSNRLVRESAVRIAGYFGFEECVNLLFERCADDDERVRRVAIEHLPYLEDERVLPMLASALRYETPQVRAAAARAFAHIEGGESLPYLLTALGDPDPWVRYFAVSSLGRHAFPEALAALSQLAQYDPANQVRVAALKALGQIGGMRAVAVLAPFTSCGDADLERTALQALGRVGHPDALPPLLAALGSPGIERRVEVIEALSMRRETAIVEALQLEVTSSHEQRVKQAAIAALLRIGTAEAVATLIALSDDRACREECITALASLDASKIEWIARGLEHPRTTVRCAIVEALARMRSPHASEQLARALDDAEPAVRLAAISAFGHLSISHAEYKLAHLALRDSIPAVRRAAQVALQQKVR
ncbi:MAG: PBS lyase [Herpetosiphonaceae bacterium]|nr:MAG: PBS lyase [Herpetosiphonaceae bacterium]